MRIKCPFLIVLMIIFISCNKQLINPRDAIPQVIPPPFSFLDIDPNNTNLEYINRMKQYDKIIQSSPVPVFIIKKDNLPKYLIASLQLELIKKLFGLYVINSTDFAWPKEFIFINRESSPESILSTYFHEYQHYQCQITSCYCVMTSSLPEDEQIIVRALREKHAIENELKVALEMKDDKLIKRVVLSITFFILYNEDCTYKMASLSVVKGKYWGKAIIFLLQLQKGKEEKIR